MKDWVDQIPDMEAVTQRKILPLT